MATSNTYVSQVNQLNENIQIWSSFISQMNLIIESYQVNVNALQEQIDNNETRIEGLLIYIDAIVSSSIGKDTSIDPYIKLPQNTIYMLASSLETYSTKICVFSNTDYIKVESNKTVNGLYLLDNKIVKDAEICRLDGNITGTTMTLTTTGMVSGTKVTLTLSAIDASGNLLYKEDGSEVLTSLNIEVKYERIRQAAITPSLYKPTEVIGKFSDAVSELKKLSTETLKIQEKFSQSSNSSSNISTISNLTKLLGITK